MNIAIVYDAIYPYMIGGAEKRNREFAEHLAARGHTVTLAGMKCWAGPDVREENGVRLAGICPAVALNGANGRRSIREALFFGWHVYRHLRKTPYDIVDCISFPFFSCIAAERALRGRTRTGLAVTWLEVWDKEYWQEYAGVAGRGGWIVQRIASSAGLRRGAISEHTARRLSDVLGIPRNTIDVIPCGIDMDELSNVPEGSPGHRILYAGRLAGHKKVDDLIAAFAAARRSLAASVPGFTLIIVGKGPEEARLRRQASESGAADAIRFEGFLERKRLLGLMKGSLAFVLPSEREGMGIIAAEAMGLGVPVVVREAEGSAAASLVHEGKDALLYRTREELEKCLVSLAIDPSLRRRLSAAGFETAGKYDLSTKIVPQVESWYRSIIKAGEGS